MTTASEKMYEILANRDRIRRRSEVRASLGMTPFPTAEDVTRHRARTAGRRQRLQLRKALDAQRLQDELDSLA